MFSCVIEKYIKRCAIQTFIIREVVLHRTYGQLLSESINLVQEQNDTCLDEPSWVADGVEQRQCLLHTIDRLILEKQLIIFRDSDQKEDRSDVFETMDPLLSFRSLSTNIKHPVREIPNDECRFSNTRGLNARAQYILVTWNVFRLSNTINRIEVTENWLVNCLSGSWL